MKHWLMAAALICFGSIASASDFKGRLGLDSGSIGAILVHDFKSAGTLSGAEWDTLHISFKDKEVAEVGAFVVRRDGDRHILAGPSLGAPGGDLATISDNISEYFDWPVLNILGTYGQYVHGYLNVGWDFSEFNKMRPNPDLIGLGGVLKFGH